MNEAVTIRLPGVKPLSWNLMNRSFEPRARAAIARQQRAIVGDAWLAMTPRPGRFSVPVRLVITSYVRSGGVDPDNIYAKPLIDAVKKLMLHDDNPRWVREVCLRTRHASDVELVIEILPVQEREAC